MTLSPKKSKNPLVLDLVIPVYNEASGLEKGIKDLHAYLTESFPHTWQITIADNASTDGTLSIAHLLSEVLSNVKVLHLEEKGRGRALKKAWLDSTAEIVAYADVDLSTDLRALSPLIAPLLSGHSDIAIGSRLTPNSRVVRGAKRDFISRTYNIMLKEFLGVRFTDAQCGFKAIRRDVAEQLLPLCEDNTWFFDTEMLVLGERAGLRIYEVPVDWIDDPNSSVAIAGTAMNDIKGMIRMRESFKKYAPQLDKIYAEFGRKPFLPGKPASMFGQIVKFGIVGVVSTLAYGLLYLLFSLVTGAQVANFMALLVTTIANTAANRKFTFGINGRHGAVKNQFQGILVFLLAWGITTGSLVLLHSYDPHASSLVSLAVLTGANLFATVVRFILFRFWVFRSAALAKRSTIPVQVSLEEFEAEGPILL